MGRRFKIVIYNLDEYAGLPITHKEKNAHLPNVHIGFNEPGTPVDSETHMVNLTAKTIADNSRFFIPLGEETPTQAVSMGLASIMRCRGCVKSGAKKCIYK